MTTSGKLLAVVRLYQPEIVADREPYCDQTPQVKPCGDEENRTLNPRLAKAVLCQLSYVPERTGPADPSEQITRWPVSRSVRQVCGWLRPTAPLRRPLPADAAGRARRLPRLLPAAPRSSSSAPSSRTAAIEH